MTRIAADRALIGLSVALAPYWFLILSGVAWGIWGGGDPITIGQSIVMVAQQNAVTLPLDTSALAPVVLALWIAAIVALRRGEPRARDLVLADKLTLVVALPYLAVGLYFIVAFAVFWIACSLHPCSFLWL